MTARIPLTLLPALQGYSPKLCHLWKIARTDGTTLYFTDHSNQILFEGQTYSPAGGANASATQKQGGMAESNKNMKGVILTSDAITFSDLKAGKYRDAQITEYTIDWSRPFVGALYSMTWRVVEVRWTGQRYDCEIAGLTTLLRQPRGDVYSRPCRWDLGEASGEIGVPGCKVSLATMTLTSRQVTAVNTQRLDFDTNIGTVLDVTGSSLANSNNWFNFGLVTWNTGANAGIVSEVKTSFATDGRISFQTKTPFDIAVSDQFDISPGCDKLKATCVSKFDNVENYGGFDTIPGSDAMYETPNAK